MRTFVSRHLPFPSWPRQRPDPEVSGLVTFYTIRLQAERDRAQLEAAKAAQMTQFMTGLLQASDPYADRAREGEPTVRELLDAGASRVERELAVAETCRPTSWWRWAASISASAGRQGAPDPRKGARPRPRSRRPELGARRQA